MSDTNKQDIYPIDLISNVSKFMIDRKNYVVYKNMTIDKMIQKSFKTDTNTLFTFIDDIQKNKRIYYSSLNKNENQNYSNLTKVRKGILIMTALYCVDDMDVLDFLSYQCKTLYNNDTENFSSFLHSMRHKYRKRNDLITTSKRKLIKHWIKNTPTTIKQNGVNFSINQKYIILNEIGLIVFLKQKHAFEKPIDAAQILSIYFYKNPSENQIDNIRSLYSKTMYDKYQNHKSPYRAEKTPNLLEKLSKIDKPDILNKLVDVSPFYLQNDFWVKFG